MTLLRPRCPNCGRPNDSMAPTCWGCHSALMPSEPEYQPDALDRVLGFFSRAKEPSSESTAHKLMNALVSLWTLGYLALIVWPMLNSHGADAAGVIVGVGVGAVLFVPWIIGMVILVVLRSTMRSR